MKHGPLIVERTYNALPVNIWKALTDNSLMKQWYFNMADFKPEVGFEFEFTGGTEEKQYLHKCRIIEVVPERRLVHTWRYEGYPGESIVTIELFPEGHGTRVRLTHEGLETFPQTGDFARENFDAGWNAILGTSLKEFIEKM